MLIFCTLYFIYFVLNARTEDQLKQAHQESRNKSFEDYMKSFDNAKKFLFWMLIIGGLDLSLMIWGLG